MIISHRLKFACFRVPKTGSTTMMFMLRMSDVWDENDILTAVGMGRFPPVNTRDYARELREGGGPIIQQERGVFMHSTPEQAIEAGHITQEQLEEYHVFICCREPLARYMSAFRHRNRKIPDPVLFRDDIDNEVDYGLLTKPTVDYAYSNGVLVADCLDFADYAVEVKRLLAAVGVTFFPIIPRMNRQEQVLLNDIDPSTDYWTPSYEAVIEARFAEDFAFYDAFKAGNIPTQRNQL